MKSLVRSSPRLYTVGERDDTIAFVAEEAARMPCHTRALLLALQASPRAVAHENLISLPGVTEETLSFLIDSGYLVHHRGADARSEACSACVSRWDDATTLIVLAAEGFEESLQEIECLEQEKESIEDDLLRVRASMDAAQSRAMALRDRALCGGRIVLDDLAPLLDALGLGEGPIV